jgi:hypothetical protein
LPREPADEFVPPADETLKVTVFDLESDPISVFGVNSCTEIADAPRIAEEYVTW